MKSRYWLLCALGLAIGLAIPLWIGGAAILPTLARLDAAHWLALLALIGIGWNCNAGRLRLLAAGLGVPLGQGRALATVMATEFAICATPAGSGGPATYAWLLSRQGLPSAAGAALYAADQVIDLLFFSVALLALGAGQWLTSKSLPFGWELALPALLLLLALSLLLLLRYRLPMFGLGKRLLLRLPIGAASRQRLLAWLGEFRHSLALIGKFSLPRLLIICLLCASHWLCRYSVLYLVALWLGGSLGWWFAFVIQMLALTLGQLTLLPGGSGGTELTLAMLLAPLLDPAILATTVLVWRFITFYWYLLAGGSVFAVMAGAPLWRRLNGSAQSTI